MSSQMLIYCLILGFGTLIPSLQNDEHKITLELELRLKDGFDHTVFQDFKGVASLSSDDSDKAGEDSFERYQLYLWF
jgi:hypothetical protein